MISRNAVLGAIRTVVDDLNAENDRGTRIDYDEDLVLLGMNSPLDSLDFVNCVIGLEERLRSELGFDIDLTMLVLDETANQPFRSVSALADYLVSASGAKA